MGPGGQNTNNAKKPRRDPTVPQRYRGSSAVRGDSEEIDFSGLHLDTKTNIASQWDAFIDTKTTYTHFLNIKLKCTIGLPSTPLRFACATHRRSWTEHMGRARICHSRHESTCTQRQRFPSPNEGHHTANKQGTTCKAVEAISIAQHRRYTIWTPHMKLTQSDRAGMLNLNDTLYHTRPVHDTQLSLRMRQSNPSHGSSAARESWPSKASRRL